MIRKLALTGALIASFGAAGLTDVAVAYPYHHHYRHYYSSSCHYEKHRAGAIGAVSGAVGGGLIGGALTHGGVGGVLLGAGAGALTGHAIARGTTHCR